MDVSTFFSRLLTAPKVPARVKQQDDFGEFDAAWQGIKETLEHPDERQLVKGITSTDVPAQLRHIVDALVYEGNRTDEDTTGACLEYFLKNDLLAQLERLCEADRPHGIKAEVVRAINNLVVLLSERFLVHNAVHRPLRRLLRSCVGDEPEDKVDGGARIVGAAAAGRSRALRRMASNEDIDADLVDLMCILSSRMRAYPPLLLIFFHDKGWIHPHPTSRAPSLDPSSIRTMSPTPSAYTTTSNHLKKVSKAPKQFEFLLFSYLLRFVHREGRIGDFARAGLLFLFDIAFLAPNEEGGDNLQMINEQDGSDPLQDARDALAEFILDGDFADVMAAGLGAVYSLLPTKLRVPILAELAETEGDDKGAKASASGGMHLGAKSDQHISDEEDDLALSTSLDVKEQLDLLIKLFGFVQDILTRCKSPLAHADPNESTVSTTQVLGGVISDTTLDAIHSALLDNVLYPSILECSSRDGSAVAVLTYLDTILSKLDDGPLLTRLLDFLLDTPSDDFPLVASPPITKRNKRKTGAMDYVGGVAQVADYFADEGRFTLKDLLLDNLRSKSTAAGTAAFRLLDTLFSEHCEHATRGLLSIIRYPGATALAKKRIPTVFEVEDESFLGRPPILQAQMQETELYSSLLRYIDPAHTSAEQAPGYATYLADAYTTIERDSCYQLGQVPLQFLPGSNEKDEKSSWVHVGRTHVGTPQHRFNPSDPLVKTLMRSLATFLSNSPDENVALTGVIRSLASCAQRSLAGWISYDLRSSSAEPWAERHDHPPYSDSDSDSDSDLDFEFNSNLLPKADYALTSNTPKPALYQVLRSLTTQISIFRSTTPSFDRLYAERRRGLLFADHLDEAMNVMLTLDSDNSSGFGTPAPFRGSAPGKTETVSKTSDREAGESAKRPKLGSLASLKSFLTPNKRKAAANLAALSDTPTPTPGPDGPHQPSAPAQARVTDQLGGPSTPLRRDGVLQGERERRTSASPFKEHYDQTSISISLELSPSPAATPAATAIPSENGGWASPFTPPLPLASSGADSEIDTERRGSVPGPRPSRPTSSLADEISFSSTPWRRLEAEGGEAGEEEGGAKQVSLSTVLDNCVLLEEFLKEIVAVVSVRRALGIDQVGFL